VRALQRGLAVLGCFSASHPDMSMAEISRQLELPKPTALRLLECLVAEGWLSLDSATGRYQLTPRPLEVAAVYLSTSSLEQVARPLVRQLSDQTQQTANLGVLDRGEVLHLVVFEPERPLRYHTSVGVRELAHCTGLGKVLLADLSEAELPAILPRRTPATVTDRTMLLSELEEVRCQGFAEDREEAERGLRCLAAPVRDASGRTVAAISISGPAADFVDEARPRLLPPLCEAASLLSKRLGWVAAAS
jgi:DNA-binding IclR family transcriptional regulator